MRFRALSILIFMFMVGMSQQLKVVNATYTYYAPLSQTIEEAKITALERAQIQAIADEFGTIVTQSNSTSVANGKVDFLSVGGSEVKGEWIETLSEPVYDISYNKNFLIVSVETKGRIREIIQIPVDLKVEILRNSTDRKMISTNFKNQDIFYLYFSAPIDGWLTVYLLDVSMQKVYRLLPYRNQNEGAVKVFGGKDYVFFSPNNCNLLDQSSVDSYIFTNSGSQAELEQLYVIFSPNQFVHAVDMQSNERTQSDLLFPRELSFKDFHKWLSSSRKHDSQMQLRIQQILVQPN